MLLAILTNEDNEFPEDHAALGEQRYHTLDEIKNYLDQDGSNAVVILGADTVPVFIAHCSNPDFLYAMYYPPHTDIIKNTIAIAIATGDLDEIFGGINGLT